MTLKPCPHPECGSTSISRERGVDKYVECQKCGTRGPCNDLDGSGWNTMIRRGDPRTTERFVEAWTMLFHALAPRFDQQEVRLSGMLNAALKHYETGEKDFPGRVGWCWNTDIPIKVWEASFTRAELRKLARTRGIPRGRDKRDTAKNLRGARGESRFLVCLAVR